MEKCNMAFVRKTNEKIKMLKSQEYIVNHYYEPLSQEWMNARYRTSKQYVT